MSGLLPYSSIARKDTDEAVALHCGLSDTRDRCGRLRLLRKLAQDDESAHVRIAALNTLALVGGKEELGFLQRFSKQDDDATVRTAATEAMSLIGGE